MQREHKLLPLPFPPSRGGAEPVLSLADVLGSAGRQVTRSIATAGQLVFHAVGDTGNTRSTGPQNLVADKMTTDFEEAAARDVPQFYFHLGDVIYSFGEAQYYYDQFYDPYRGYPAPILALAGNHDGIVAPNSGAQTLAAFLRNFCAPSFEVTPEAGGLDRTAMIQPGVYFTFEAPFLRVLALYSGTLEDPGVISSQNGTYPALPDIQLDFLRAALARVKADKSAGALIVAHHHPVYAAGGRHGSSPLMQADIDAACADAGIWPHAVLSGHAHNYQRFTRTHGGRQTPYIIAGGGGHAIARLSSRRSLAPRVPMPLAQPGGGRDGVVLESYDDTGYGYLRIVVTATQLRIEYHPAADGALSKTPDDAVTVDLASRRLVQFTATA